MTEHVGAHLERGIGHVLGLLLGCVARSAQPACLTLFAGRGWRAVKVAEAARGFEGAGRGAPWARATVYLPLEMNGAPAGWLRLVVGDVPRHGDGAEGNGAGDSGAARQADTLAALKSLAVGLADAEGRLGRYLGVLAGLAVLAEYFHPRAGRTSRHVTG